MDARVRGHDGWTARVDGYGNLVVESAGERKFER